MATMVEAMKENLRKGETDCIYKFSASLYVTLVRNGTAIGADAVSTVIGSIPMPLSPVSPYDKVIRHT